MIKMSAAAHRFRRSLGIGLVIELCFLGLLFFLRLTAGYDPKPFAVRLYMGFHLPAIWLLSMMGFGMGHLIDVIPVAVIGWLRCSLLVWVASFVSTTSPRNTAD